MNGPVDSTKVLAKAFLSLFQSPQQMRDWILTFLDIDIPFGHVDPDSNSSPLEAMFAAYVTYRDDLSAKIPGYIWLSSRDSGKTLCGSILNVILMIHFKAKISHLAATRKQSEKSLEYCNQSIRKLRPYIEMSGRQVITESKSKIQVLNEDETISYIDVIVANLAGGNSAHDPVVSFDEIDTLSPQGLIGYKEAQLIPTRYKGKGPLTIKFSTRKFAFGIFEKEIQNHDATGEQLIRWNIIDVTEKCSNERHKPELPKVKRYIGKNLPLRNLSPKQYEDLSEEQKPQYEPIEAYAGCGDCPLLAVCRTRLAHRPTGDVGGLYKTVDFTIREFKVLNQDPDMAEAQLMCWKPSRTGLIYGRFDITEGTGNVLTLKQAYERYTGGRAPEGLTLKDLVQLMRANGIKFYAGVDWGFRHAFAITVSAVVGSEWWFIDNYSVPGLEYEDMVKLAESVRDTYRPVKWFADTAQPMFIKGFNRRRMPCQKFDKDVQGGIECTRGQIVNAMGTRRLMVIKHDRNEWLIKGFQMHHYKLDSAGAVTSDPDDEEYADTMDSVRYKAQNLFGSKSKGIVSPPPSNMEQALKQEAKILTDSQRIYQDWMSQKIHNLASHDTSMTTIKSTSGGFIADFGSPDDGT